MLLRPFKEKIAFKVARLRETPYCTGSHRGYALKQGVPVAELDAIDRGDYTGLPAKERASLLFTEAMVAGRMTDASFAALREHFNEAEAVEIVALIGIMELACSFAQVFDLAVD